VLTDVMMHVRCDVVDIHQLRVVLSREDGYFLLKKWSWKSHNT
jgi:hypothetical protein